jgi:hypothetical protein
MFIVDLFYESANSKMGKALISLALLVLIVAVVIWLVIATFAQYRKQLAGPISLLSGGARQDPKLVSFSDFEKQRWAMVKRDVRESDNCRFGDHLTYRGEFVQKVMDEERRKLKHPETGEIYAEYRKEYRGE